MDGLCGGCKVLCVVHDLEHSGDTLFVRIQEVLGLFLGVQSFCGRSGFAFWA